VQESVDPVEYFPASHLMQSVALLLVIDPAPHVSHKSTATVAYLPKGQMIHFAPMLCVPASHEEHVLAPASEIFPEEQSMHESWAVKEYWPSEQKLQFD